MGSCGDCGFRFLMNLCSIFPSSRAFLFPYLHSRGFQLLYVRVRNKNQAPTAILQPRKSYFAGVLIPADEWWGASSPESALEKCLLVLCLIYGRVVCIVVEFEEFFLYAGSKPGIGSDAAALSHSVCWILCFLFFSFLFERDRLTGKGRGRGRGRNRVPGEQEA